MKLLLACLKSRRLLAEGHSQQPGCSRYGLTLIAAPDSDAAGAAPKTQKVVVVAVCTPVLQREGAIEAHGMLLPHSRAMSCTHSACQSCWAWGHTNATTS